MHLYTKLQKKSVASLTSAQVKTSTKHLRNVLSLALFIVILAAATVNAQEPPQVFALPDARASEAYRANIEDVLHEKYGLKLEAGSPRAVVLWSIADGKVPPGISVRTDGTIVGTPTDSGTDNYSFRLKAVDVAVKDEDLVLNFTLAIKPARLRLTKIEGPRLVAVDMRTAETNSTVSAGTGDSSVNAGRTTTSPTNRPDSLPSPGQDAARTALDAQRKID